jgi:hypothetical protein
MPADPACTISVIRPSTNTKLGGAEGVSGPGPFYIQLSAGPIAGDKVLVEGVFEHNGTMVKYAVGESTYTPGNPVTVNMLLLTGGTTGRVDLAINFPHGNPGDPGEITAVEVSIYRGFENYQKKAPDSFKRYQNTGGAGMDPVPSGNIVLAGDYPSGTYVAQIDFFLPTGARVSRLAQTFVVRGNLTTNTWVETGSNVLTWNAFPSSNADLSGILIGIDPIENYNPNKTAYKKYEGVPAIPTTPNLPSITVTQGTPGQTITISLNGASEAPLTSGLPYKPDSLKATNSIVITVTAPDGVTKKTYTVAYIYYYDGGEWYVDEEDGDDNGFGNEEQPYATLKHLLKIDTDPNQGIVQRAYADTSSPWPGKAGGNPLAALIHISGTFTGADAKVDVDGAVHPPILLTGWDDKDGIIDVSNISGDRRPSTIWSGGTLILGDGVTLTGGNHSLGGGGVYALQGSKFIMNGGSISGNTAPKGGGVFVIEGSSFTMNGGSISGGTIAATTTGGGVYVDTGCTFTMNDGTISGSKAKDYGGGVYVHSGTNTSISTGFTMNGGTISGNEVSGGASGGGGVYVLGDYSSFTMNGGTIKENTVSGSGGINGGGVYITGGGSFTMSGGSISGNEAAGSSSNGGGGVYITSSKFIMEGGSISGNKALESGNKGGGGVFVTGSASEFIMNGGSIGGNTASGDVGGGGVYMADGAFKISGESSISGNTSSKDGGGVLMAGGAFTMSGESSVSGNTATGNAGAVRIDGSDIIFTMSGGTISGNKAGGIGGGVYVTGSGSEFIMDGGTISGNSVGGNGDGTGGGVGVRGNGKFTMNEGTISGNTASDYGGGGVHASGGDFIMYGGTISKNETTGGRDGGGGVHLSSGAFTMYGGTISENTASNSTGGGVHITGHGSLSMRGGTISGNTAVHGGGGVWLDDIRSNISMSGSMASIPVIDQNNDVRTSKAITISGSFSGGLNSPPHVARITPKEYSPGTQVLSGTISPSYVRFTVTQQADGTNWTIGSDGKLLQQPSP